MINIGQAVGYLLLDTSNFEAGFNKALGDLNTLGDKSSTASQKFTALGSSLSRVGGSLTKKVTLPLVGLGTAAVSTTSKFESAMSQVQATMGVTKDSMSTLDGQSVNTMDALSDLAKELGASTKFSAVEAAEAINYMALAGYDVQKTYGMLPTVLNLAAAGNFDLARASDMVTDAQTALGLSVEETAGMVDQWAMAASKSNTSVEQLGDAILTIGGTAQYMAGGTDRLATTLGVLADNGIKGSEAGTHLRNMILKLASPTKDGAAAIEKLGLQVFDADGKMRDFQDIFGDLSVAMDGLTDEERMQAFADMFNVRDIAAANALLGTSQERWEELGGAISDAGGSAKQMADTQLDNLSGQMTILKSSLEGMAIAFGELLLPLVKDAVSLIQRIVDRINGLSEAQKQQIVTVAKVAAAVGPALLVLGKLMTLIGGLSKGLKMAKLGFMAVRGVIAGISAPVAIIVAAVATLVAAFKHLWDTNEGFRNRIISIWNSIKQKVGGFIDGIKKRLESIGITFKDITSFIKKIWDGFCNFLAPIFTGAFEAISNALGTVLDVLTGLLDVFIGLFTGNWSQMWEGIKEIFTSIWDSLVEGFSLALETIKNLADVVLGWFGTSTDQIWSKISSFFTNLWNGVVSIWNSIVGVLTTVANWINANVIEPVKEFFAPLVAWFTELFTSIWNFIASVFEVIWQLAAGCVEIIKALWGVVADWFDENVIQPLSEFFTGLWKTVSGAASTAWKAIEGVWKTVSRWFNDNIISPISSFFTGMWNGVKKGASSAWEGIKGVFMPVVNWFREKFSAAWQAVKSVFSSGGKVFSGLKEGIANVFKTVVNKLIEGINKVVAVPFNTINGFLNTLRNINILGVTPFKWVGSISVPQIPSLFRGGILGKGEIGLLEGNGAEAVVPLDQNKKWISAVAADMAEAFRSMGNSMLYPAGETGTVINATFNINGARYTNDRELARAMSYELQNLKDRGSRTWGGTQYETPVMRPRREEY